MGIRVERMMALTFVLSGFLAGGAGVLVASMVYANFDLGLIGVKAFAAAVLGGFGSIPGALVGGVTIGLIELFSGAYLPLGVKDVAAYVVLLLVLAIRPQGMFGTIGRKKV
jgi:branched-chain amino acid transport system permease protein